MRPPLLVFSDLSELGRHLAAELADGIINARAEGRSFVLGCPGGRSPRSTYAALARVVEERQIELDHVVIAMMDEYVVDDRSGNRAMADPGAHYSCRRFAELEIRDLLNRAAPAHSTIAEKNLWLPSLSDPGAYDDKLSAVGIDVFILASGASDGHVAFNPPGSARTTRSRVVALPDSTRRDNLGTFPDFNALADVPIYGLTVGISTIADNARRLVMILDGAHKQVAFDWISRADEYDPEWPATVLSEGVDHTLLAVADAVPASADPVLTQGRGHSA